MTHMARVKRTGKSGTATKAAAPAPPVLSTVRSIDLDPDDWLFATWRPRTPRPRLEPIPFDLEACLERFAELRRDAEVGDWNWNKPRLAPNISREEAHFWYVAITEARCEPDRRLASPANLVDELRSAADSFRGGLTRNELVRRFRERTDARLFAVGQPGSILLLNFFPLHDMIALSRERYGLTKLDAPPSFTIDYALIDGFHRHVLPYLTDAESATMRDQIRPETASHSLPQPSCRDFSLAIHLAAMLGMHDELSDFVARIPDHEYAGDPLAERCDRPQRVVLGLASPTAVVSEMRRLNLRLRTPDDVRGWIAHTEDSALDLVRDSILSLTRSLERSALIGKQKRSALIEVLARVKSPRTAAPMLELMLSLKSPRIARRWLDEHPGHAIPGLIPIAAEKGKMAAAALAYLRAQKRKGHGAFLEECLAAAQPDVAEKVRDNGLDGAGDSNPALDAETSPDWLESACEPAGILKSPGWVAPGDLPPILIEGRKLSPAQEQAALAALARSTFAAPHPLTTALRAHADRRSLDAFAWSLLERWIQHEAPPKENWALAALGLLGSDDAAHDLPPMIRIWAGRSRRSRAHGGLECLRAIGSDLALAHLNRIAREFPVRRLGARAAALMWEVADERGLSRAELEDRIVPTFGLGAPGGPVLDFGPRQFRFALDGAMKPMIRDAAGKLRRNLPTPNARDAPASVTAAIDRWNRLKRQVPWVARTQAERLERTMVSGRRWRPAEFETFLVQHPLLIHLVRRILWGCFDSSGQLVSAFRVSEERDYSDVNEAAFRLDGGASVGIVHPVHLSHEKISAWGQVFAEHEILPPFPQLGRAFLRLAADQRKARGIARIEGLRLPETFLRDTPSTRLDVRVLP